MMMNSFARSARVWCALPAMLLLTWGTGLARASAPADQNFEAVTATEGANAGNALTVGDLTYTGSVGDRVETYAITPFWGVSFSGHSGKAVMCNFTGSSSVGLTTFRFSSTNLASDFRLNSLVAMANEIESSYTYAVKYQVRGYNGGTNGTLVASVSEVDLRTNATYGSGSAAINFTRAATLGTGQGNGGTLVFGSAWDNIDTVVFTVTDGKAAQLSLDSIDFSDPTTTGVTLLGNVASTFNTNNATLASFTVPAGNNRLLVVSASDSGATNIAGVTFNGLPLTLAVQKDDGFAVDSFWYRPLGSSVTATSGPVVFTRNSGSGDRQIISALAFQNVDQAAPVTGATNRQGGAVSPLLITVPSKTGDLVLDLSDLYRTGLPFTQTPGNGQDLQSSRVGALGTGYGSYKTSLKSGASSVVMSWTNNGTAYIQLAMNLNQAVANVTPSFVGGTTTLNVNQDASATSIKALLHVSDTDSAQTLTWSQQTGPAHGTLTFVGATAATGGADVTPGGTITYTPTAGYFGSDSFVVTVSDGLASATRTITVTVSDVTAPTITSVTGPANGSYRAGQNLNFIVNFSEAVTVNTNGGVPSLGLTIGVSSTTATYLSGNGTALTFRHIVQAGENDADGIATSSSLTLNGGTLGDASANAAVLTLTPPVTTAVLVDTTAPAVSAIARMLPLSQAAHTNEVVFNVSFSEPVTGVTSSYFHVSPLNGGTVSGNVLGVSGGPQDYSVAVQINGGTGEFRLDVIDN